MPEVCVWSDVKKWKLQFHYHILRHLRRNPLLIILPLKAGNIFANQRKMEDLGFRKAKDQNRALLSKTAWALSKHPSTLAMKAMKARYGNFLDSSHRTISNQSAI